MAGAEQLRHFFEWDREFMSYFKWGCEMKKVGNYWFSAYPITLTGNADSQEDAMPLLRLVCLRIVVPHGVSSSYSSSWRLWYVVSFCCQIMLFMVLVYCWSEVLYLRSSFVLHSMSSSCQLEITLNMFVLTVNV